VQPEFTAWTWGNEDDPEGELQPPGSSSITAGSGSGSGSGSSTGSKPSTEASPDTEQPKLTWWQRYLLKKRGK